MALAQQFIKRPHARLHVRDVHCWDWDTFMHSYTGRVMNIIHARIHQIHQSPPVSVCPVKLGLWDTPHGHILKTLLTIIELLIIQFGMLLKTTAITMATIRQVMRVSFFEICFFNRKRLTLRRMRVIRVWTLEVSTSRDDI